MAAFSSFKKYMKGSGAGAKGRPSGTSAIRPLDFAQLLISMSRLLNQLDAQPGLAKEKLGVGEWVSLTVISESGKLSDRQLAKALGVPGRRVREIIAALQRAGRISYVSPAVGGAGNIELTDAGAASLARANAELLPALETVLKGRGRLLAVANKQLRLLTRVAAPAKPPQ